MSKKEKYSETAKEALDSAVNTIIRDKANYVHNPEKDFTRNRKASMKDIIKLILSMEGGSLNREIYNYSQISQISLTASAFVQQRSKISSSAFQAVFQLFNEKCQDSKNYRGYHLLAVDGSDINQNRNPDADTFVINPSCPEGYNQTHLNALYDLCNKTYVDIELQPRPVANEQKALVAMLKRKNFPNKSIIIADRGYVAYNIIAHLLASGADFLLRLRSGNGAIRAIKELPMMPIDIDIAPEITTTQTNEDKSNKRCFLQTGSKNGKKNSANTKLHQWDFPSPYTLRFRVVRFLLDSGEYETIATSLPRDKFPPDEIKKLYHMRWGIETSFRELKYNIGLVNLHCKKDDLVRQELYAAIIMYNFCSRITNAVNVVSEVRKKYQHKVNFSMAVYLCRRYYKQLISAKVLLQKLASYMEPIRPGRQDKRKLIPKRFIGFTYRVAA